MTNLESFLSEWRKKTGSQAIANHRFLEEIDRYSDSPGLVDFGAGIGTISAYFSALNSKAAILAIEPDDWCRNQFHSNLEVEGASFERIRIVKDLSEVEVSGYPGWTWAVDMAFSEGDVEILSRAMPRVVLVEGHRYGQRLAILRQMRSSGQGFSYTSFGGNSWSHKGGCAILPSNDYGIRQLMALYQVAFMHFLYSGKHGLVRLVNLIGLGAGGRKKGSSR